MKSTNRGENWNIDYFIAGFNADIAHSINTSFFLNNNTGIIGAGKIFRTINSGISWDSVTNSSGGSFQSIFFINDNTGWASYNYGYGSSSNLLLKTTNSGLNWFNLNASISTIYSLYFVNSNTGWFTGFYHLGYPANISRFYIYKTTDGGLSYATQLYNSTWEDMYSIFFINENTGWAGGTKLWKTTDGGNSWNFQSISVRSVKFINELTGFLTNNTGIYKSSNGGLNWEFKSPFEGINISVLDSNNYFIAGNYGTMIKTSNQGDNWEYLSQNTTSNSNYGLYFTNEFTGFCISHYWSYPPYPSSVLKTTDKGYHWNFVLQNTPNDLNDVYFNSASTGWLLGDNGLLYKSTNIGISWNVQNLNTSKNLYKMFFLTSNTGWILSLCRASVSEWLWDEAPLRQRLHDRFLRLSASAAAPVLNGPLEAWQRIDAELRGQLMPTCIGHGDFAPWNINRDARAITVFDWEYAQDSATPLHDFFHFHCIQRVLVRRSRLRPRGLDALLRAGRSHLQAVLPSVDQSAARVAQMFGLYLLDTLSMYVEASGGVDAGDRVVADCAECLSTLGLLWQPPADRAAGRCVDRTRWSVRRAGSGDAPLSTGPR